MNCSLLELGRDESCEIVSFTSDERCLLRYFDKSLTVIC